MNKVIFRMKKSLSLVIILCQILFYCPAAAAMQQTPLTDDEITISMDFKDADLKDILKVFSMQSGLNFVASEGVQDRKVTLYFDNVPLEEAINQLFKANNLTYEMDRSSNIFLVKDWGKPQLETVTRVFYLKYATVSTSSLKQQKDDAFESDSSGSTGESGSSGGSSSSGSSRSSSGSSSSSSGSSSDSTATSGITDAITQILTKEGNIIEDARTNSLIITDVPSRMPIITQVVAALDIPVPQIMLEVEMLDVSKNTVDKMGVKWPQTLAAFDGTRLARATAFPFSQDGMGYNPQGGNRTLDLAAATASAWTTAAWPASRFGPAIVSVINGQIALDYLRTQTDTKYLARPRILTLNNETAEIKISTNEAIGYEQQQSSGGSLTSQTTAAVREQTGVILKVTPQVNTETGEVTMFIAPVVRDTSASSISTADNPLKDPEERSTKSLVRIRDGETVIIGGLIRNQKSQTDTELPGLAKIPVLGALFRHKNKDKDIERELLVFITPHIIKDNSVLELANKKSFVMPDREQQAGLSAIDRQSAISASLNNFDKYRK